jgi:hypothetical protein
MGLTKARKTRTKHDRPSNGLKHKQKVIDSLLQGLDALVAQAESADMGTAARIFYTAREDLVHWAVTMHFHESAQDRFINRRLYDNRLSSVEAFITRAIQNADARSDVFGVLGLPKTKISQQAMRKS